MRIVDIAGLFLGRPERVLALGVERPCNHEQQLPPVLPMELGLSSLLDELDAVMSLPGRQHGGDGKAMAYRTFLAAVDRAVPSSLDVYLICASHAAHPTQTTQPPVGNNRRFLTSYAETEQLWGDKVIHFLGHRSARSLRRRTGEIKLVLKKWIDTHTPQKDTFAWVCSAHDMPA